MKKIISTFLIIFSVLQTKAQFVKGNLDQVKSYLCKSWEINYSMAEGVKIVRAPGGKNLIYNFNQDGTVYFYDNSKTKIIQDWRYNENQGDVIIAENGKTNAKVVSLNADELAMIIYSDGTPDPSMAVKVFFKVKK
jgi:hypothetical protein